MIIDNCFVTKYHADYINIMIRDKYPKNSNEINKSISCFILKTKVAPILQKVEAKLLPLKFIIY